MIVTGLSQKKYVLDVAPFKTGGEGDIYMISGEPDKCVKIYHTDRISQELEKKLTIMLQNPPSSKVLSQVAWPIDVVYDSTNSFIGFVMPKLDITEELIELYKYPPQKYKNTTTQQKIIVAINICVVISEVHRAGYVFGDFNPRNIGINLKTGRVAFLDTDSYHIYDRGTGNTYRCKVCLDGYVAPELLAICKPYKSDAYAAAPLPTFTKETDNFSLAVHIFKLLMNGYTPFNGIKETDSASTASPGVGNVAVERDSYCFKPGNKPLSVAVPPLESLPDEIANLFTRAFMYGRIDPKQRPTAVEWYQALEKYEKSLKTCPINPVHQFKNTLLQCPWCEADERYKNSLTPSIQQHAFSSPVVPAPISAASNPVSNVNPSTYGSVNNSIQGLAGNIGNTHSASTNSQTNQNKTLGIIIGALIIGFIIVIILAIGASSKKNIVSNTSNTVNYSDSNVQEDSEDISSEEIINTEDTNISTKELSEDNDETSSNYTVINIPPIEVNALAVESNIKNSQAIDNAIIIPYSGNLAYEDQEDSYIFEAPYYGNYHVKVNGLQNNAEVELYIYDMNGDKVEWSTYCGNNDGITGKGLLAGSSYEVRICQKNGLTPYALELGVPKSVTDISGLSEVIDSIEYGDQINYYTLTPLKSGKYRFEFSNVMNDTEFEIYVYNNLGESVEWSRYCGNGDGISVNLNAEEEYEIQVCQKNNYSNYTLSLGQQKELVDISNYTEITDSIEYKDQRNIYTFIPSIDGRYRFEFSNMMSGTNVEIYFINSLRETLASNRYCGNGEGITVKNLIAGEKYEIQVCQQSSYSNYNMMIGHQKENVDITTDSIINDSVEYIDQRNVYMFKSNKSGDISFTLSEMNSDVGVEIIAFNSLNETVESNSNCGNNRGITIKNVSSGDQYEVQIRQKRGIGSYSLTVE